jgi:phosphatidylglycerophosphatase A
MSKIKIPASYLKDPRHFLSLGFGSGLAPKAPGTFGTLAAIPPWLIIQDAGFWILTSIVVIGFVIGVYLCEFTSSALGVHDHSGIVWDEFIGFWMTMMAVPSNCWQWLLIGFLLFRLFDIVKPWPIKLADEKVQGGFGIMIDDVLAAVFAIGCVFALRSADWIPCG